MHDEKPAGPTVPPEASGAVSRPRRMNSSDLLRDAVELIIVHGKEEYRLRKTRQGKLILIK